MWIGVVVVMRLSSFSGPETQVIRGAYFAPAPAVLQGHVAGADGGNRNVRGGRGLSGWVGTAKAIRAAPAETQALTRARDVAAYRATSPVPVAGTSAAL
jgi:hypothetical protein